MHEKSEYTPPPETAPAPEKERTFLTQSAANMLEMVLPYGFDSSRTYTTNERQAIVDALYITSGYSTLPENPRKRINILMMLDDIFVEALTVSAAGDHQGLNSGTLSAHMKRLALRSAVALRAQHDLPSVEDLMAHAPNYQPEALTANSLPTAREILEALQQRTEPERKAAAERATVRRATAKRAARRGKVAQTAITTTIEGSAVPEGMRWHLDEQGRAVLESVAPPGIIQNRGMDGATADVLLSEVAEYLEAGGQLPNSSAELPERLCLEVGADVHFPETASALADARKTCSLCAGRVACLLLALQPEKASAHSLPAGVRAGLTQRQRSQLTRYPEYQAVIAPSREQQQEP